MAQQIINNGDSGLIAREKINGNCTELYGALVLPLKLPGMSANANQAIAANNLIVVISVTPVTGTPTLRIGITPNGQEILLDTLINKFTKVQADQYFSASGTVYFTFSGSAGEINVRMDILNNYF